MTLRAVECLARADVVFYDYLVNPASLEHAADGAKLVRLGKSETKRRPSQDEINTLMVEAALEGKTVARLKGGDPSVFGRGADETDALRAAGVSFEIVPGITTGLAAGAYCEIPMTHHEDASAVALVAGRERTAKAESGLDYAALAAFPGTLILYMGVGRVDEWSGALIEHGKPAGTPVAIVRWCTRAQQEMIRCTLGSVAETILDKGIRPPSVFVVGDVVARAPALSWFTARPLFGTQVFVAGTPGTSGKLRDRLEALGAHVLAHPAIRVADPPDWAPVDAALDRLEEYDWLVFSSGNGVDYLLRRLFDHGWDARRFGRTRLAAVGAGTAERLARYHLRADLVPEKFVAESLAAGLIAEAKDGRFLIARASRGRQVLAEALRDAGAHVDQIVVYANVDVEEPAPEVAAALAAGTVDWVAVTSSATAHSLARLYGEKLGAVRFASIGPIASASLHELGYAPTVEATPQTTDGIVEAILRYKEPPGNT
jgi:uroporphyrinogen III methyltransferase/synthase